MLGVEQEELSTLFQYSVMLFLSRYCSCIGLPFFPFSLCIGVCMCVRLRVCAHTQA